MRFASRCACLRSLVHDRAAANSRRSLLPSITRLRTLQRCPTMQRAAHPCRPHKLVPTMLSIVFWRKEMSGM